MNWWCINDVDLISVSTEERKMATQGFQNGVVGGLIWNQWKPNEKGVPWKRNRPPSCLFAAFLCVFSLSIGLPPMKRDTKRIGPFAFGWRRHPLTRGSGLRGSFAYSFACLMNNEAIAQRRRNPGSFRTRKVANRGPSIIAADEVVDLDISGIPGIPSISEGILRAFFSTVFFRFFLACFFFCFFLPPRHFGRILGLVSLGHRRHLEHLEIKPSKWFACLSLSRRPVRFGPSGSFITERHSRIHPASSRKNLGQHPRPAMMPASVCLFLFLLFPLDLFSASVRSIPLEIPSTWTPPCDGIVSLCSSLSCLSSSSSSLRSLESLNPVTLVEFRPDSSFWWNLVLYIHREREIYWVQLDWKPVKMRPEKRREKKSCWARIDPRRTSGNIGKARRVAVKVIDGRGHKIRQ